MPDREKVLKALKCCANGCSGDCPYFMVGDCGQLLPKEALELLKEQEAVPVDNGKCPSCNWDFENGELDFSNINESLFYCPRCGKAVKFDD